jgi:hypothetical protein
VQGIAAAIADVPAVVKRGAIRTRGNLLARRGHGYALVADAVPACGTRGITNQLSTTGIADLSAAVLATRGIAGERRASCGNALIVGAGFARNAITASEAAATLIANGAAVLSRSGTAG